MVKTFPHLKENEEYYFDEAAALRVVEFVETFCRLSDPMGEPFILLDWQRQIVMDIFGWHRKSDNRRRFKWVYIEVPRKNGKTYFVAALLLYCLIADGVVGGEVYASACSREQSGILFNAVRRMILQSEWLSERLSVLPYKSYVRYANGDSELKALSGESYGSHGKYPSAVVMDELHEWRGQKAAELYEALTSGFGNRRNPLVIQITTAGYGGDASIAQRQHHKAKKFELGECEDPTFYGVVYGADLADDWTLESTWEKANPSWELAKNNLHSEYMTAKSDTSYENTFKRLYLNIWTEQQTRWLSLAAYDAVVDETLKLEDFKGKECVIGLDLSDIYDLTGCAIVFPEKDKWYVFVRTYIPAKTVEQRSRTDAVAYDKWVKGGHAIATTGVSKGVSIDYETVVEDISQLAHDYRVNLVAYDPHGAERVIPYLEAKGIATLTVYQKGNDMNAGTKEFERRIMSQEVAFAANPCLRWQIGNVEVKHDNGTIRPVKPNAKGDYHGTGKYKNDGVVAAVIAYQAALLTAIKDEEPTKPKAQIFYL